MPLLDCMEVGVVVGWWCMSWEATYVAVISNRAQLCTETSEGTSLVLNLKEEPETQPLASQLWPASRRPASLQRNRN